MIRWIPRLTILLILFTVPFVATGCWDRIEIEERGTILALAIDPLGDHALENATGPNAKGDAPGYVLTAQIAIPGRIPLGPGGGGSSGTASEKPVWIVRATGKTIDDAMNALQLELAEKVFLGHLRVIIVNQEIAKRGEMQDIQDVFRRNAEIRRLAWLMISTEDAASAMSASPKLERVPTLYLVSTMDHAVELGKIPNVFLGNYWTAVSSKGRDPVLPLISVKGKDQIKLVGLAVFSEGRMVDQLVGGDVAAYMELTGERRAGYALSVPMPGDPAHSVIARGTSRVAKIKLRMTGGKPSFDVYSKVEANIEEKTGTKPVDTLIDEVQKSGSKLLVQNQMKVLSRMQEDHADVFGFGEYIRGEAPRYWRQIQTKDRWEQQFTHLPVRIHAEVAIRRSGMAAH